MHVLKGATRHTDSSGVWRWYKVSTQFNGYCLLVERRDNGEWCSVAYFQGDDAIEPAELLDSHGPRLVLDWIEGAGVKL